MIGGRYKIKKNLRLAIFVSVSVFALLMIVSSVFIYNYSMRVKAYNENSVAISYYSLNDEIRNFRNRNISLLSGFAAYIQLNDTTDDEEIYQYLDFLLKDQLDEIRNIGVLEDTTIRWMYPLEGNESAIGSDLSTIPGQAEEVAWVKSNLKPLFVGPVNLVQGGTAFIVRMPLLKKDVYWGMVSIVLKAESAFGFVDQHSENYHMSYLITSADQPNVVIYGNTDVLNMSPMKFRTDDSLGSWDVYVVPENGWDNRVKQLIIVFIMCLLVSLFISWRIFLWMRSYTQMLKDKVELEGKYILDRFTGIYTREYFNFRLQEEVSISLRNAIPISMVYFDLDHFKNVNDVYGHSAGDDVLLEVVKKVKSIIRFEDVFARWGGDEFILLLPNTNLENANFVAERIRSDVEGLDICKAYGVTASIGCSEWKSKEYVESWFLRTDQALYTSKNTGKNKVTLSDHNQEDQILVKVDWDEKFNSGCHIIDDEHRLILERCNKIVESALEQSSFDETVRNVELIIKEMEQHFNDEIDILVKAGYPDVETHKRIHDALLQRTESIFQRTIKRDITAVEFFTFLVVTVVSGHFNNEDVKYFPYIEAYKK